MNELESAINKQNLVLRKAKKALIIKKEVPLQVTQNGIVASMSTVDYTACISLVIEIYYTINNLNR